MAPARSCPACGARVARAEARFCDACGLALPDAGVPEPPPGTAPDLEERFRALETHPRFEEWMRARASAPTSVADLFRVSFLTVALLALAVAATAGLALFFPPAALVQVALVLAALLWLAGTAARSLARARAPLAHLPALVVARRTRLAGREGTTARTDHRVELRLRDGSRREVRAAAELTDELPLGQVGVALLLGDELVRFDAP